MEATALSIGKSVLNGALGYAKSAVAEEVALQLGVHRDKAFITDELEMMQYFLMEAHEERDGSKVIKIWVKQVRDVAYDVEDCLQDFVVRLQKQKQSWWLTPRRFLDRHHVAKQMKEMRTKVEDVSQRNLRYRLIKGSNSTEPANAPASAMFGVDEARHAAKQHQSRLDLAQLINKEGDDLGVIGVWGTSGSVGHTSIISEAYKNINTKVSFPCRAWVRVMRPLNPTEFIHNIVKQFRTAVGVGVFLERGTTDQELALEYNGYVNEKRYLIVLTDLSTIEEWHQIKACFPENKLGSRIIVSTEQVEVASLCAGQASVVSELKQLSADQTIYAFYSKSSQDVTYSSRPASSSMLPYTSENEIQEDQSNTDVDGKLIVHERLTRTRTMIAVMEEIQFIGREKDKSDIIGLILEEANTLQFQAIAVWGMGGLGKTTLIKDVYERKEVSDMFGKHAFVPVLRPFKLEEFLRTLAVQLDARKDARMEAIDLVSDTQKNIVLMGVKELIEVVGRLSQGKSCLIVLDDLSSTIEWDTILESLLAIGNPRLVIVITTRREDIAKYCCKKPKFIRLLNGLEENDACNLFTKKVFKNKTIDLDKDYPELVEPAKLILKKCNGLPLAIVTIGGFLADQPTKTAAEWRKLNDHISVELEMNPKLEPIKTVLMKSYDGLPYYLKACFLYLSIFPEDRKISLRRLVCRWIAEGYSREVGDKSAVEIAERYFVELIERSMILPTQSVFSRNKVNSCQLHDLIRDISISKSVEENLVFRLEGRRGSNTHGPVRHLAITSNWEGDEIEFRSIVELSRIRSLTVFGKWRPFYVSAKMRFLRVLDLEETEGLADRDLENIGKLLHLRFLSLRGCQDITYLPDSVGNLRQLETLDIKYTEIIMLPKTIVNLTKLRDVHARVDSRWKNCYTKCRQFLKTSCFVCAFCCSNVLPGANDLSRLDFCTLSCCMEIIRDRDYSGVMVPRGTRRLKALRTLRYVDLGWGNSIVKEIKGLTELSNLGVVGINKKNGRGFCSAISSLSRLESLSVEADDDGDLNICLDNISTAPENLQSLKLYGSLEKLPEWIKGLQNLVKLTLDYTSVSSNSEALQALGNLPNLSILCLAENNLKIDVLQFQSGLFRRLRVLNLVHLRMKFTLVEFEEGSMPNLEVLNLRLQFSEPAFSGLEFLQSIKEVRLAVSFSSVKDKLIEELRIQLDRNKNRPVLKVV